jgi:hypothetical protein
MDVKSKGLLRRMFDLAVSEIARRAATSEPAARRAYRPKASEPVRRTVREVAGVGVGDYVARVPEPDPAEPAPSAESARAASAESASTPAAHSSVVIVRGDGGDLRVRWRVAPEHLARATGLLGEPHVPCLRLITFSRARDAVTRDIQDRPNVGTSGECEVRESPERLIATFGLRAGERFVSVAHAVL